MVNKGIQKRQMDIFSHEPDDVNIIKAFITGSAFLKAVFFGSFIGKKNTEIMQDNICVDFLFKEFGLFAMKM